MHIESFDPHEPFVAPQEFRDLYGLTYESDQENDWPDYRYIDAEKYHEVIERYRKENMAVLSFCSYNLKRLLDRMTELDMWKDTMLIVNTDHGFLLGEHNFTGKGAPYYNEVANIPFFLHDPRLNSQLLTSNDLVQTVDIPATILDYFNIEIPCEMTGMPIINGKRKEKRETAVFGVFGGHINIIHKDYVYMRAPRDIKQLSCYTLSGIDFARDAIMEYDENLNIELGNKFVFTKGCKTLKVNGAKPQTNQHEFPDFLFNIKVDPAQENPLKNANIEGMLCEIMRKKIAALDVPPEIYDIYEL